MGVKDGKTVTTPGIREKDEGVETQEFNGFQAFAVRSVTMRAQYLALDRQDVQYASKELARCMQAPSTQSWQALKRLGRYLKGKPRLVWRYYDQ